MPDFPESPTPVVVDTNVLVAAGFKPRSDSARLVEEIRRGALRLVWNEETLRETERIIRKIPPLSWDAVADLFREGDRFAAPTEPALFHFVPDPDDRKFAALATAAGAALVTMDAHLLGARAEMETPVLTPSQLLGGLPG